MGAAAGNKSLIAEALRISVRYDNLRFLKRLDIDFPTLDLDNPTELTEEEKEIIDDLAFQFTHSNKIKNLMRYLFEDGKLYHVNNHILNLHALIPSTADGKFEEFMGKRGKELLDYLQSIIKNIGQFAGPSGYQPVCGIGILQLFKEYASD